MVFVGIHRQPASLSVGRHAASQPDDEKIIGRKCLVGDSHERRADLSCGCQSIRFSSGLALKNDESIPDGGISLGVGEDVVESIECRLMEIVPGEAFIGIVVNANNEAPGAARGAILGRGLGAKPDRR